MTLLMFYTDSTKFAHVYSDIVPRKGEQITINDVSDVPYLLYITHVRYEYVLDNDKMSLSHIEIRLGSHCEL
jgi:hypothetical protein